MGDPNAGATLERNLAALRRAQPELAARLELPVDGGHVDVGPPARYLHHKAWVPLGIDALGSDGVSAALERARGAEEVLAIGVGVGDLLAAVLAAAPDARVTAWDRDPWLLRVALSTCDVAERVERGGLRLALSTDLIDLAPADGRWGARVEHPLLAQLYRRETALARRTGPHAARPTAALATGGLLVESLGDALARAGYDAWPLPIMSLSLEEMDHQMARLAPALVVAVNYTNGLAELAARHGARLLCWEIDPTTTPPRLDPNVPAAADAGVFTWRAADVATFQAAGFRAARHLPIGADVDLRRPVDLTAEEREHYEAPLSFVGASLMRNAGEFRERFFARCVDVGMARADAETLASNALAEQRVQPARFLLRELLEDRAPALFEPNDDPRADDPALLLGELAAAEKRLTYVANLGRHGIHAWGDPGWEPLAQHGVRYRGPAGHRDELTKIYNTSGVNVDVGRLYQNDIVTLRTFDVLACGGFALVEHTSELTDLFEVGRELVSYRTLPELLEKAGHYAEHPDEARAIAQRGLAAVRERHTVDLRLAEMLRGDA